MFLNIKIRRSQLVTLSAFKLRTDFFLASLFVQNPFTNRQRRLVPDVLIMTARKFCTPILFAVLIESDDRLLHQRR